MKPRFLSVAVIFLLSGTFTAVAARADTLFSLEGIGGSVENNEFDSGAASSVTRNDLWGAALPGPSWGSVEFTVAAEAGQTGNTYRACSDFEMACVNSTMIYLPASNLHSGSDTWGFDLAKRDTSSNGLDSAEPLIDPLPSPEPGSLVLFGSGLLGVAWLVRRRFAR
jgi:hypothetical protein